MWEKFFLYLQRVAMVAPIVSATCAALIALPHFGYLRVSRRGPRVVHLGGFRRARLRSVRLPQNWWADHCRNQHCRMCRGNRASTRVS